MHLKLSTVRKEEEERRESHGSIGTSNQSPNRHEHCTARPKDYQSTQNTHHTEHQARNWLHTLTDQSEPYLNLDREA